MRHCFDQLAKKIGRSALDASGPTFTDAEIAPDAQRADLRHEPDPAREAARRKLGLLGELAARPCLIEVFSQPPSADDVRACLQKHLAFWQERAKKRRRAKAKEAAPELEPWLWILTSGSPTAVLGGLAFVPAPEFPAGVYRGPDVLRIGLVVASELPRERSTLLVRLMAAGRGLVAALQDLSALPAGAHEHRVATEPLLSLRRALTQKAETTAEEREIIMSTANIVDKLFDKGRAAGRLEEARAALRSVLSRRGLAVTAEEEAKIDGCTKPAVLRRWLDQAIDAPSAAEALR